MQALRDFVARHVETYEELETLAVLAQRGGGCARDELPAATRLDAAAVETAIRALAARGVVAASDRGDARLALDDPRLAELLQVYRADPVAVLKLLNALAIERLRSGATRAFADAFLLRRKHPDG